jgi:hypothetical protein
MLTRCLGWPAPHVPPVILHGTDDGRISDGICAPCAAVFAITQAPPSTTRLARFVARLEADRFTPRVRHATITLLYPSGATETINMERLR